MLIVDPLRIRTDHTVSGRSAGGGLRFVTIHTTYTYKAVHGKIVIVIVLSTNSNRVIVKRQSNSNSLGIGRRTNFRLKLRLV
jgi:hypothetical protein